jgi:hypothetical protein
MNASDAKRRLQFRQTAAYICWATTDPIQGEHQDGDRTPEGLISAFLDFTRYQHGTREDAIDAFWGPPVGELVCPPPDR